MLHNICIDLGDLYDCSESDSDDSDSEDNYAGPLQVGSTEVREVGSIPSSNLSLNLKIRIKETMFVPFASFD